MPRRPRRRRVTRSTQEEEGRYREFGIGGAAGTGFRAGFLGRSGARFWVPAWSAPAAQDAEQAAGNGQDDGLDEEPAPCVPPPRAGRLSDGDFRAPLGHGDRHDVHDPDPADDRGIAAHRAEQQGEYPHLRLHPGDRPLRGDDFGSGIGRPFAEPGPDILRRRLVRDVGARAGDDDLDSGIGDEPPRGGYRHEDGIVRICRISRK